LQMLAPTALEGRFLVQAEGLALFVIVPEAGVAPEELLKLAEDLRAAAGAGLPGEVLLGGFPAYNLDYRDTVADWFPWVIALVLGTTFLALFAGFRSVLIPVKAVILNLVSVGAAFGALQLVFVTGWGAGLLGLAAPVEGVFPAIPILMFCIAFGLSMDYEVFLLARIKEEYDLTGDNDEAVRVGIGRTGPIVTAAAVLLAIVFLAIATSGVTIVKMFGFGLALAVITDAFLVRATLTPALMKLAGRLNWWAPGPLRRFHLRWGVWETDPVIVPGATDPFAEPATTPTTGGS